MKKLLLTDIDGVLLDWSGHFNKYLETYYPDLGLMDPTEFVQNSDIAKVMQKFNHSAWIGYLKPHKDAAEVLLEFQKKGYEIICCTAMGYDQYQYSLRKQNLENVFPGLITRMDVVGFGEPKNEWLSQYKDSGAIWVEDKWTNAVAGADQRLNTFLMKHEYNAYKDDARITKVDNWQQILGQVT